MEDRPRPQPTDATVLHLSPSRAELLRFFAWGYFSRRELNDRLRGQFFAPRARRPREPDVPTAA